MNSTLWEEVVPQIIHKYVQIKSPMYEYHAAGSFFQTLILLKFIDISDFPILNFGAMNLLLFLVGLIMNIGMFP